MATRRSEMTPEQRAAHDAEVAERDRAAKRRWNAEHPEYKTAYRQANRARIAAQERERTRRERAAARKRQAARERGRIYRDANRDRERERGRRLRQQHPERVREYTRRFRERHPERFAEQQRRATRAWRDRNAEHLREADRRAAAARREVNPDEFRDWYHRNLERERERSRQASRLRSRLTALGLPPRRVHRTYASDKRAHETAADAFFTRTPDATLRDRLRSETFERGRPDRLWTSRILHHVHEQPPSPHLVERFRLRSEAFRLRDLLQAEIDTYIAEVSSRYGGEIRAQVRLDAVARNARRGPPIDIATEVDRRIRVAAVQEFQRHRPATTRALRQTLDGAIAQVRTQQWWQTADRAEITEMWHLAHTATPDGNNPLTRLLDAGTRGYHGITARLYIAGYTAADLPWLHERAQARRNAQTPPVVTPMPDSRSIRI